MNTITGADPERMTIPTSAAELEAMLGDSKAMQRVFSDKNGAFGEFITNYARAVHNRDLSIATQVKEETQRVLADWLRDEQPEGVGRLNLTPEQVIAQGSARNNLHNPRAMGAVLDREFDNSAEYFRTIWHNANRTADMQAKLTRVRNAFSSTVPSEGGFLIPETLRSEMLRVSLETSIVRPRARVIPMETLRVPFPAIDSTSNVSSVYGGVVGYWTEEGAALTASQAAFSRIVLDAKKLTAYSEVPNELISDSAISFQAFLDEIFPEALGFYEDIAFIKGSGVGEPLGVLDTNNSAIIAVAKETGQAADTIVWENIVKMYARMLPSSLNRAVWIASNDIFPELATMALSVGTGGSAVWLNNGVEGPPMTILGRPVIFTEKAPGLLGDQGDISFVDFGFYLIGDRQVMSAMSSPHFKFQNDQTAYRIIQRVDGRPWLQSAITPQNNGPTLSPFVQLAARA
ncbi:phage major capsid protein [Streptomyces sp. AV19]|uniref:phage major capsid protein n=1 Tax=Streptomyces sp. AV19 TaxID=2793068 RepID=UPI0018FE5F99|nr:phage major capsid protein [Streptomyces sp. AV19]MBH1939038.1 phage major capsid protein [Streptomyces sp. AV19]MDG4531617.1 phage major capsid protein [Streptomyces sp. AV19]